MLVQCIHLFLHYVKMDFNFRLKKPLKKNADANNNFIHETRIVINIIFRLDITVLCTLILFIGLVEWKSLLKKDL